VPLALTAGTRLGPFEIVAPIGAGGMGEVYRAKDTKLNREVAIKVLPPRLAHDPERLGRFKREATVLASLNHPNIAAIYGLDEMGDTLFLVLELVEGEDLAQRLTRGAIPPGEALAIARQIATALEEAHEKGIVHRDLKPANVKLTPDGKVKVLDFGLAKAYSGDSSGSGSSDSANSPTMTHAATTAGMILGTAAYMSPEQARGSSVDRRADIWAFGAVVFEMLTGRGLFRGETATDIVAAVMRDEIDWSALPAATPEFVRGLLARCLDRDVKRRLQAIGEARVTLEEATTTARSSSPAARRGRWLGAGAFVLVAAAALALWSRGRTGHDKPVATGKGTRSIAVLPFVNSSGSPDDEYLADGMTDELIAGLGKVPGLHVAARSSAFTFKGQKVEVREVSRKLGVDTVLEGTLRRSGKRLRVTASLVNAADGLQLWSSTFENDGGDAFAVQDQVTRGVVTGLSLQLGGAALEASQAGRTKDPEAHDLYLRGLAAANASSESDLRRALELYQQAIARDPDFALPYVGIAWVHAFLADAYVSPMEAYPKALAAARAALARDDRIADAHALLAFSMFSLSWGDKETVEREFARALELDPNSANSRFMLAGYRCFYGPAEAAFGEVDRTAKLDPLSPLAPMLREFCNYVVGRYDAAIEAHRITESLDPSFIYFESWAGASYRELGDYPSALREYAAAAKSLNDAPQYGLALTYLRMGRTKDAADIMRSMDERARSHYVPFFARAVLHAAMGDIDTGVALLQKAVDGREQMFLALRHHPEMAPLVKDPRARHILDEVEALRKSNGS
jgi:eukaryotic-like serine/threonine-protein kinase